MNYKSLLAFRKVRCFSCGQKVKDRNLAKIQVQCADGILEKKICRDCEKIFGEIHDARNNQNQSF